MSVAVKGAAPSGAAKRAETRKAEGRMVVSDREAAGYLKATTAGRKIEAVAP
jgi:hypothetical protein